MSFTSRFFVALLLCATSFSTFQAASASLDTVHHHKPGHVHRLSRKHGGEHLGIRATKAAAVAPLRNFQVMEPPVVDSSAQKCTVVLVDHHEFANSYGRPAKVQYTPPPTSCAGEVGKWGSIVLNYTATSNGTQYDRLSSVYLSHVEILRTSTAEPTKTGIVWTALKDVTKYTPLFSNPGTLLLDLGNIVDLSVSLNGNFTVTLSATFYAPTKSHPTPVTADVILPLSTGDDNQADYFAIPSAGDTSVKIPQNALTAVVEIYANGNAQEEFWYTNVPDTFTQYFSPDAGVIGKGPFREVQLSIDGKLAGTAFPFPVIFTGGVLPTLWRPIVAYGAFDQPTYQVDITPFLPNLTDSQSHTFSLNVTGQGSNTNSINGNWFVSGNIQISLNPASTARTTGKIISFEDSPRFLDPVVSGHVASDNSTVQFTVKTGRKLKIQSTVVGGDGVGKNVVWEQNLDYTNAQDFTDSGFISTVRQNSLGSSISVHTPLKSPGTPRTVVSDTFSYPITLFSDGSGDSSFVASLNHSFFRTLQVPFPSAPQQSGTKTIINTVQSGHGQITFNSIGRVSSGSGTTKQTFSYLDGQGNTYVRNVLATNATVTSDSSSGSLANEKLNRRIDQIILKRVGEDVVAGDLMDEVVGLVDDVVGDIDIQGAGLMMKPFGKLRAMIPKGFVGLGPQ